MSEIEKMLKVKEKSQVIGEFIEWLQENFVLAKYYKDKLYSEFISIEDLLAQYFNIDLKKVEEEKRKILEDFTSKNV